MPCQQGGDHRQHARGRRKSYSKVPDLPTPDPGSSPMTRTHFFTSTGSSLIFAARMKSFSVSPLTACVQIWTAAIES
jgi:hypothetical protein